MTPALLAVFTMPFTYSVASGIEIGVVSYTLIKAASGRWKETSVLMWILTVLFILKEALM